MIVRMVKDAEGTALATRSVAAGRAHLRLARLMAELLGTRVRVARLRHGWPEAQLAERAAISRATLQKIERGEPAVALSLAPECCAVLDVSLSGGPVGQTREQLERARLELAALPKRIRAKPAAPDDDF
jgi:transcriptional regulator with XRE-family HTH domain